MKKTPTLILVVFAVMLALVSCARQNSISSDVTIDLTDTPSLITEDANTENDLNVNETKDDLVVGGNASSPSEVIVPILMFHDVKTYEGGTWSMSADNFRGTLEFLLAKGYTPISFELLVDFVDEMSGIPENPVCITLDDGYFSNYRNVLPIITELDIPVTVFMTCKTVRSEEIIPSTDENVLYKMSSAELEIMQMSPFVQIQSHSYGLHGVNTSYSDVERDNLMPLETESKTAYKEMFSADCELAEEVLNNVGVDKQIAFSYPSGKHHGWAEEVLRERNYRVSVTTDYGHKNLVIKGNRESLFLLGRMNVNDETTEADLLRYLERN